MENFSKSMEFIWDKIPEGPIYQVMSITVITNIVCPIKGGKQEDE